MFTSNPIVYDGNLIHQQIFRIVLEAEISGLNVAVVWQ